MLRWDLGWGAQLKFLKDMERDTGITPRALADRPLIRAHLAWYLEAFYEMSAGRDVGESVPPITTEAFRDYCEIAMITDPFQRLRLFEMTRQLDIVYCQITREKRLSA